jgi:chromate transporter
MAAIFGTVLPSFGIILLIAWIALPYFAQPKVTAFLRGCAIAVVGQLAFAGLIFARKLLRSWRNAIVCIAGLIVVAVFKMHPVWAMIAAGGMGYLLCNQSVADQNEKDQS